MAKIRVKQAINWFRSKGGRRFTYYIQKRTLWGWEILENKYGMTIAFYSKGEANTFLRKYNSLKKSVSRKIN